MYTALFNTGSRWQINAYIGDSSTGDSIASTGDYTSISVDKATGWYVLSGWTTKGGTLPPSIVAVTSNTAILTVTGTTTQYYVGYKSITSPTISTTTTNLSTMIAKLDNIIGSSTGVAYFAAGA